MEYFVLERTFICHLVYLPYKEEGCLQLDQVTQSPVQPDQEYFQGWGRAQVVWQPQQVLTPEAIFINPVVCSQSVCAQSLDCLGCWQTELWLLWWLKKESTNWDFFLGRGEGVGKGTMRTRFCISPFCCLFLEEILGTMSQTGFHHWCEPLKKIFIVLTAYYSRHYFMFYCLTGSSCHINLSFENNYSMWILCSPIRTVYVQTQSTCRKVTSRFILQRIHFSGCLVRLK